MKIIAKDTFGKSLKKLINTKLWWKWAFYEDKYYEFKWRIWAFRNFNKIVTKETRPWDYHGSLEFLRAHFKTILKRLETTQLEVDETRIPKEKNIKRCIELLTNVIEENYAERCGYDYKHNNFEFIPYKDNPELSEMVYKEGSQSDEEISEIFKKAKELEEKEWIELWDIIKNGIRGWWS